MDNYSYCIFYLENKYYRDINNRIKELGLRHIKAIIPTLKILKRTSRGKMFFEEVPVLFNYGFIKMPTELAFDRNFLHKLKRNIPGIKGWLKDNEPLFPKKKRLRIDNAEDWDDFSKVATVSLNEIKRFRRLSRNNKSYLVEELMSLKIGDYIILQNYPFEGIDATIKSINYNEKTVEVIMYPEMGQLVIKLPFEDIFYTVYKNYDPDKLIGQDQEFNPNVFTKDYLERVKELRMRKRK